MSELPNGWSKSTLLQLCTRIVDGSHNPPKAAEFGKPMLSARNIQKRTIRFDNYRVISNEDFLLEDRRTRIAVNDVLLTIVGTIGRVAVVQKDTPEFALQRSVAVLKPNPAVEPQYLGYLLESPRVQQHFVDTAKGTAQKGVYLKALGELALELAPLPEQTRIANQLDTLLARVQACNDRFDAIPALLKRFRQTVLDAGLSGALLDIDNETAIESDVPKVSISTIAAVGTGSTPLRSNSQFFAGTGTPWVTSSATSNAVITTAHEFVTLAAVSAHRLKLYPKGTLLVAMYGEGKTRGQVAELGIDATINQACAAIVVDKTKALTAYVKLALQANYLSMRELAEGGNQPNLNLSKVKEFEIPLPSLGVQTKIVHRVQAFFALADRIEARCNAARTQAQRLNPLVLAKAFRGELVPQDPNDEPASALLARIASSNTVVVGRNKKK